MINTTNSNTNNTINSLIKSNLIEAVKNNSDALSDNKRTTVIDLVDCSNINKVYENNRLSVICAKLFKEKTKITRLVIVKTGYCFVVEYCGKRDSLMHIIKNSRLTCIAFYKSIHSALSEDSAVNNVNCVGILNTNDIKSFSKRLDSLDRDLKLTLESRNKNVSIKPLFYVLDEKKGIKKGYSLKAENVYKNNSNTNSNDLAYVQYSLVYKIAHNTISEIFLGSLYDQEAIDKFNEEIKKPFKTHLIKNTLHVIVYRFLNIHINSESILNNLLIGNIKTAKHNRDIINLYKSARLESIFSTIADIYSNETYYINKCESMFNTLLLAANKVPIYVLDNFNRKYKNIYGYTAI